jgi:hypothetical protein
MRASDSVNEDRSKLLVLMVLSMSYQVLEIAYPGLPDSFNYSTSQRSIDHYIVENAREEGRW